MKLAHPIEWTNEPTRAIALQRELAAQVIGRDEFTNVAYVAGLDVGFEGEQKEIARAVVVILKLPELTLVEAVLARRPVTFPYVPGLLAFREVPVMLDALEKLKHDPDVLMVDGQGIAHPRRLGIASHLGVVLDCPAIGCAKSRLVGEFKMPPNQVGARTNLTDKGEIIGVVLRTRVNANPLFISIGHRVSLETAVDFVSKCARGYRLPEPTRRAHNFASGLSQATNNQMKQESLFD